MTSLSSKKTEKTEQVLSDGTKRTTTVITTKNGNETLIETRTEDRSPSGHTSIRTETKREYHNVSKSNTRISDTGPSSNLSNRDEDTILTRDFDDHWNRAFKDSSLTFDGAGEHGGEKIDLDKFRKEALSVHNVKRQLHGAPKLTLDKKLCDFAQNWAEHLAKLGVLQHRPNCDYGENVYMCAGSMPLTGEAVVQKWYDEVGQYDFSNTSAPHLRAGHFSQVVWHGSKQFGIGAAKKEPNIYYVVANYNPSGNIIGKYRDNVKPVKK